MSRPDRTLALVDAVLEWYQGAARDLPWRRPEAGPWGVLVSEFMLQQTPVDRVLPVWAEWMTRWPSAPSLAAEPVGEAVRAWGRLGYPRRALRLHAAAVTITAIHGGEVPRGVGALLSLPGVGSYTAGAVLSFAFGERHVVLDTNVRRVLARAVSGQALPTASVSSAEQALAAALLPTQRGRAASWAAASMELGALVCTARAPRCEACPVRELCSWQLAGRPSAQGEPRRAQRFAGTDRQVRGILLAAVREAPGEVSERTLESLWDDDVQRERALHSLLDDGLLVHVGPGGYALPG